MESPLLKHLCCGVHRTASYRTTAWNVRKQTIPIAFKTAFQSAHQSLACYRRAALARCCFSTKSANSTFTVVDRLAVQLRARVTTASLKVRLNARLFVVPHATKDTGLPTRGARLVLFEAFQNFMCTVCAYRGFTERSLHMARFLEKSCWLLSFKQVAGLRLLSVASMSNTDCSKVSCELG